MCKIERGVIVIHVQQLLKYVIVDDGLTGYHLSESAVDRWTLILLMEEKIVHQVIETT